MKVAGQGPRADSCEGGRGRGQGQGWVTHSQEQCCWLGMMRTSSQMRTCAARYMPAGGTASCPQQGCYQCLQQFHRPLRAFQQHVLQLCIAGKLSTVRAQHQPPPLTSSEASATWSSSTVSPSPSSPHSSLPSLSTLAAWLERTTWRAAGGCGPPARLLLRALSAPAYAPRSCTCGVETGG